MFILCVMVSNVYAQHKADPSASERRNMVKFNILPLLGGKFAFEYERLLTDRIALGAGLSIRPEKGLPFASTVKGFVDEEELDNILDDFKSSNFSFTPEVRFYTSRRGPFRGFYVAPYAKFVSYKLAVPYQFDVDIEEQGNEVYSRSETIPLKGILSSVTAGLSVGFNFKLKNNFHLDWRLFGPGYGTAKGDITGTMKLDADEQSELKDALADLKTNLEDMPLAVKIDYDVHGEGATITVKRSPWSSIRTGLGISYRF